MRHLFLPFQIFLSDYRMRLFPLPRLFAPLEKFCALEKNPRVILFVCQGNICRSPYAAEKCRSLLREKGIDGIEVRSAGTDTTPGKPANATGAETAARRGVALDHHRTESVAAAGLEKADLVVIMDYSHWLRLKQVAPDALSKTFYLGSLLLAEGGRLNIRDPYGSAPEVFDQCFDQVDAALEHLVHFIAAHSQVK